MTHSSSLLPREPFEVEVKELGWFPNERSPRVLWAGVHGGDPLIQLARETDELSARPRYTERGSGASRRT